MREPWKTEPIIWEWFCKERQQPFNDKRIQELFNETRSMKEEYEWFMKGFISRGEYK